jgi:DNA-binding FadR family transcriptional regulator
LDHDWITKDEPVALRAANSRERAYHGVMALSDFIERHIADGSWAPGQKIPTERELETQFGVARNTLRKTLRAFEEQGKIVRHVGQGSFVAGLRPVSASNGGTESLEDRIRGSSPAEVMEIRLMIEPHVVELAAVRATSDQLLALDEALRRAEQAQTLAEFEYWDGRLHQTIIDATRNGLLATLYDAINTVRQQPEWAKLKERTVTPERRASYEEQHRAIVAAIKERDPEAARTALRDHLLAVRKALVGI